MKIKTAVLLGLMTFFIITVVIVQFNNSSTTQHELAYEPISEAEGSENDFDCASAFLTKDVALLSVEAKNMYCYESDFILFDLSKDFFRPPSFA